MKNWIFILTLYCSGLCSLLAQVNISGKITESGTNKAVEFANIGIVDRAKGTVSDFDGSFSMDLQDGEINATDTLQISRIGYQTLKFSIRDFVKRIALNAHISMEPSLYELKGITVRSSDAEKRRIGYKSSSKRLFGFWNDSLALGGEHASKIMVRKGPVKLEDLSFNVVANISDSILVRVNVYQLEKGLPGKNISKANILHTIKQPQGTISINLSPYNIVVDQHFVISLELLKIYGGRVGIGISAFDDGPRSYTRLVSQGKWKRIRKGFTIAFNLNTSEVDTEEMASVVESRVKRKKPSSISLLWDTSGSMKDRDLEKEFQFLDSYFKEMNILQVKLHAFSHSWTEPKVFEISNGDWSTLKKELSTLEHDGGPSSALWDQMKITEHTLFFTDGKNFPKDMGMEWSGTLFTVNGNINANHKLLKELAEDHGGNYLNLEKMGEAKIAVDFTQYVITDNLDYLTQQDVKKASIVKGNVGDWDNPLSGVAIKVRNSDRETRTDSNGNFSVQAFDGEILDFSYPGRENASSVVNTGSRMLKIIMPMGVTTLNEVVLEENIKLKELHKPLKKNISTRFGTLDMNKVGFSVKQMEGNQISPSAQTIMDAVEGKFPGVKTIRLYPEDYEIVLLRDKALAWDVDGHVYPPKQPPFHINLHNVKDITILPPAWSTARYGRLAPGGIIIVRTISNTFDDLEVSTRKSLQPQNKYAHDAIELASTLASKPLYVQRIAQARSSDDDGYLQYLKEQKNYGSVPSFYLESSTIFKEQWNDVAKSNQIKSNLLELFPENVDALKILAYSYEVEGLFTEATYVYNQIHQVKETAQAKRDLARILTKLKKYEEAWHLYKSYISLIGSFEDKELDKLTKKEILLFVQNHADKIGFDKSKISFEELGDLNLIVEWNDPNTQFELQFVDPLGNFFNWNNTVEISQEENESGSLSAVFDIDELQQGQWLVNMTYMGNQANLPTYLKFTLKDNNTGQESIKMIALRQRNVKYKVMNISSQGMLLY